MRSVVTMVLCFCGALASGAGADTYIVRPDGSGDYPTIQDAVTASQDGDLIELADGTFAGAGNRDIDFADRAITVRSQGGNPEVCIIDCGGSESEPHRGFSFTHGEGPASVLEGVTITNGWMGEPNAGGAVQCRSSSNPTITNCRFVDNYAGGGAGVWCQNSSPVISGCVFSGGSTLYDAGGLYCTDSSPMVTDCLFLGNVAGDSGGAVACNFAAAPTFEGCVFSGNASGGGGAVVRCDAMSAPAFTRCTFTENSGLPGDSAVYCRENAAPVLESCIIAWSAVVSSFRCVDAATATLSCCDVYGNEGGDWVDCIAGQAGADGNLSVDPELCSTTPGADRYWTLQSDSPCAPGNHPGAVDCGVIGAHDAGCGTSAVERSTWGSVKATFR